MPSNTRNKSGGDVDYCPRCGSEMDGIGDGTAQFFEDLILDRYRTEFACNECGYHGEVIRHNA
jgi:predicted RNA-binding Zn-ribbon protein involved in translation (DUF1610 family)